MRPDELGAALVIALDENLSLKERQERDRRLLEQRIDEARRQLEAALGEYRLSVEGLEGRVNELGEAASRDLALSVAKLSGSLDKARKELAQQEATSRKLAQSVDELSQTVVEAKKELAERVEEVAAQKPVEVTHTVEHRVEREVVPDGSGVKNFSRPDDKDWLVLETIGGTKYRVKLPKRVVQHIDQGGGGGGISETRVLELIDANAGGAWGAITGTLSNQTDLQTALDGKEAVGVAAAGDAAHVAAGDPHPQYLTAAEGNAAYEALGAVATHAAAADPHTGYQKESEKDAANGYAGLSASSKLAGAQQTYGTGANTACEGNDARLSDSRAPNGSASGDLGGTYPSPTVTQARGLRETAGPTTLAVGAVADGEFLKRVGATVVGATPTATAADPAYAPGSFTISTETGKVQPKNLTLSGAQRATLEGTARLVMCG